jgi:hypothetical protein
MCENSVCLVVVVVVVVVVVAAGVVVVLPPLPLPPSLPSGTIYFCK